MAHVSRPSAGMELPAGYAQTLTQMKDAVRSARISAARRVNTEMIVLYWRLGRLIDDQMQRQGWRARVVDRLSADLREEIPDARGFSPATCGTCARWPRGWPDEAMLQQVAATLGWGHIKTPLDNFDDPADRNWYARRAAEHGWSRNTLIHHIATGLRRRVGAAPNNFTAALPAEESELVRDVVHDPVRLDLRAAPRNRSCVKVSGGARPRGTTGLEVRSSRAALRARPGRDR